MYRPADAWRAGVEACKAVYQNGILYTENVTHSGQEMATGAQLTDGLNR